MKRFTIGLKALLYSITEQEDSFQFLDTVKVLLFSSITTQLEKEMAERLAKARPEFFDGNLRTETAFADSQFARYILAYYDSNKFHFEELVYKCRQRFRTNDISKKFTIDQYYLGLDTGRRTVCDDFEQFLASMDDNSSLKESLEEFLYCLKKHLSEGNCERALAMLILYSVLNTDTFLLNWQFKGIDYSPQPSEKISNGEYYIIKPYLNKDSHLAVKSSIESVNHTVDHSCIQRPILVNTSNVNMNENTSIFQFKKIRKNIYYILQDGKYLQWLGITSNSRLTVDAELNHRCRWKLTYIEDAKAFTISPNVDNRIIKYYSAVDIPNGAIHAENLPLWIFFKNTTRSQMFQLHHVNINCSN